MALQLGKITDSHLRSRGTTYRCIGFSLVIMEMEYTVHLFLTISWLNFHEADDPFSLDASIPL